MTVHRLPEPEGDIEQLLQIADDPYSIWQVEAQCILNLLLFLATEHSDAWRYSFDNGEHCIYENNDEMPTFHSDDWSDFIRESLPGYCEFVDDAAELLSPTDGVTVFRLPGKINWYALIGRAQNVAVATANKPAMAVVKATIARKYGVTA